MKPLAYAVALSLVAAAPMAAAPAPLPKPPKNKVLIVGVWELVGSRGRRGRKVLFEFTRGGELRLRAVAGPPPRTANRRSISYSVDGDKLRLTFKGPDGMERKVTNTITRLTDTELHFKTESGSTSEFRRKKE